MTALRLRPANQDDLEMLWVFLAIAAYPKVTTPRFALFLTTDTPDS
jgi:hypothetical protein